MAASVKSLVSQTAIYGLSAIVSKFLNYLLTPYFTYIMSESVYGEVTLFYALIPFVNILLTMGLSTAYFRWAGAAESLAQKKTIFSTLWSAVTSLSIIFFLCCWMFQSQIATLFGYNQVWYSVLIGGLIAIDNINAIPLAALRQQGKALRYTIVNVSSVLVNIVACIAFYQLIPHALHNPAWVLVANLIASLVSTAILLPSVRNLITKTLSPKLLKTILKYSLPLMLAGLMGVGSEFLDRYMIEWILPADIAKSQVGIYGAVAKVAALMLIFRQIYTLGAEPFFLQKFSKDDFLRMNAAALKYFVIVGLFVVMSIWMFSDIFALIIGERFRVGMSVVPILLVANLLMGVLVNLSFWYKVADKTHYATYVTVAGLIVTVSLSLWLIPRWGYVGAAWTHLSAAAVMVLMSYIFNQVHYRVPYDIKRIGLYLFMTVAICLSRQYIDAWPTVWAVSLKFLLLLSFLIVAFRLEKLNLKRIWKR